MEEINLKELWEYFVSKLYIVIIVLMVAILVSNIYILFLQTPLYKSTATLVLTRAESSDTTSITQNDVNLNQKLVGTYSEIIKSRRILNKVIKNLKIDTTWDKLQKNVSVKNKADTELITITVVSDDSKIAPSIANEIADVFSDDIVTIYNIQNVSIIDYAIESERPYNINYTKQTAIAFVAGLVISCAIIFVMFYFDTTIKSSEEIEEKLGVTVLGSVPMHGKKKGGKR